MLLHPPIQPTPVVWTRFFGAQPMSGNPQQGALTRVEVS